MSPLFVFSAAPHRNPSLFNLGLEYPLLAHHRLNDLIEKIILHKPQALIMVVDTPDLAILSTLSALQAAHPLPVIMFAQESDTAHIQAATQAGVQAYIAGELPAARLKSVLDAAIARFENFQTLKNALNDSQQQLAERKIIERAKGLIMQQKKLNEMQAYQFLRDHAMQNKIKIATLAEQMLNMAQLLL